MWVRIGCGCVGVRRGVEPPCVSRNRVWQCVERNECAGFKVGVAVCRIRGGCGSVRD